MPACGSLVGGKYRILRSIGEGGMGAVFEAENVLTLKRAAVKWLHPRFMPRASAQERMMREARATSRIRHRNVVDLYDVVLEGSAVVLVMELLTGELLADRLRRGPTTLHELVSWLLPAMEGVAAAHAVGVVHRDIKPENIFLARETVHEEVVPKVIDFGISKTTGNDLARLTQSGMALGTPRYISFEQLRGDPNVDARSDVYAFGVMLYEALLGRPPYQAHSLGEQAVQFITYDPPRPKLLRPELPDALSALVCTAISRDRDQRFDSMESFMAALRPFAHSTAYEHPMMVWEGAPPLPSGAVGGDLRTLPARSLATRPATPASLLPSTRPVLAPGDERGRHRAVWVAGGLVFCLLSVPPLWPLVKRVGALHFTDSAAAAPKAGAVAHAVAPSPGTTLPAIAQPTRPDDYVAASSPPLVAPTLSDITQAAEVIVHPSAKPAFSARATAPRPDAAPPRTSTRGKKQRKPSEASPAATAAVERTNSTGQAVTPDPALTSDPAAAADAALHRAGPVSRDQF
jgi:serine/threonine-protein kinase